MCPILIVSGGFVCQLTVGGMRELESKVIMYLFCRKLVLKAFQMFQQGCSQVLLCRVQDQD